MLKFEPFSLENKAEYEAILRTAGERGCEYSFTNLFLWGRQRAIFMEGGLAFFSQFCCKSVYPFPVGCKNIKPVLDAIMEDAVQRGISCRLTSLTAADKDLLESLYPGRFHFHCDRDDFDYVYNIETLSTLRGKKLQSKRNYVNRFTANYPDHVLTPITPELLPKVEAMVQQWYDLRTQEDPYSDYLMEQVALRRALQNWEALELEGMALLLDGEVVAMAVGSWLTEDTFDIHFEKALDRADGAYAMINRGFAAWLQEKYPQLKWLNREDDMGLPGLRKAKLSYYPDRLVEKYWACLREDGYDY